MKKLSVPLLLAIHLIYPVCLGIGIMIRREFVLTWDWGFLLILTLVTVLVTCVTAQEKTPLAAMAAVVLDGLCALGCGGWIPKVCVSIWIICCVILYIRCAPAGRARNLIPIVVIALVALLLFPLTLRFLVAPMLSDMVFPSSTDTIESPDGRYTVYMHTMDYGIAAGITRLSARDNSEAINILIGKFYPPAESIGSTHSHAWFEDISWPDEHTMMIGDEQYTMP